MPLWETTNVLLSMLVSSEAPHSDKSHDEELETAVCEISRACFMAPMDRETCIVLPAEDLVPEDGDAEGILRRSVYGFSKARVNWQRDWQKTICEVGYNVGLATFCTLLQRSRRERRVSTRR